MPKLGRHARESSHEIAARDLATHGTRTRPAYDTAMDATYRNLRIIEVVVAAGVALLEGILGYNRQKENMRTIKRTNRWQNTVQDTMRPVWAKTQDILHMSMDTTQNLLGRDSRSSKHRQHTKAHRRTHRRANRWQDSIQGAMHGAIQGATRGAIQGAILPLRSKTQNVLRASMDTTQNLLGRKARNAQRHKKVHQPTHWQDTMQEAVQPAWNRTRGVLQSSMDNLLNRNGKDIRKRMKRMHKRVQEKPDVFQGPMLRNIAARAATIGAVLATAQEIWRRKSRQPKRNMQRVVSSARNLRADLQQQYRRSMRKQLRARSRFRLGLAIGLAVTLLYTPLSGSETRQRLTAQWDQFKNSFGFFVEPDRGFMEPGRDLTEPSRSFVE